MTRDVSMVEFYQSVDNDNVVDMHRVTATIKNLLRGGSEAYMLS
jgi:hypothetical protein